MTSPHQHNQPPPQPPALDPNLDAAALAQLASQRRDLWPAIQRHPNCYPELRDWIGQQLAQPEQQPTAQEWTQNSQAQPEQKPTEEEWARNFQAQHGREPTMSEYQAALRNREMRRNTPTMEEFSEGAKRAATGAKNFFDQRVAPAAKSAARQAQNAYSRQSGSPQFALWSNRAPLVLAGAALIAIFSLMMPIASFGGMSVNFFHEETRAEGIPVLILLIITIGASAATYLVPLKWLRITTGVIGAIAGLFATYDGFANVMIFSDMASTSVGMGVVLLGICGLVMLAATVLTFLSLRHLPPAAQRTPQPPPATPPPHGPQPSEEP